MRSRQATARAEVETTEPFDCGKCGYRGDGDATGRGEGSTDRGGLMFGNDRADEIARDTAEAEAWSEAMSHVALAACPRCGARDRAAWIGWLRTKIWKAFPAGLVLGAVAGLALGAVVGVTGVGRIVTALVGGVAGVAVALAAVATSKAARTRAVRFHPREPDSS